MASCENLSTEGNPPADGGFPVGLKVLAVDDDPLCLRCLEAMLKRCSYDVVTAKTAAEAIAYLRKNDHQFDIVLSDVHMPDMDGFKLLEIIGLEMDLPVIMISANSDSSVVLRGVTHGAVDYLIKPVRIMELRNIWQHVIRKKHSVKTDEEDEDKSKKKRKDEDSVSASGKERPDGKRKKTEWSEDDHQEFVEGVTKLATEKAVPKRILDMMGVTHLTRENVANRLQDDSEESDSLSMPKKPRVMWSVELHQGFVDAVNQLGIDKAVPKRILDIMGVSGLTRENVASHLQKYRLYLKRLNGVRKGKKATNAFDGSQEMGGGNFGVGMDSPMSNSAHMFEQPRNPFNDMQGMAMSNITPQHDQYDVLPPGMVSNIPSNIPGGNIPGGNILGGNIPKIAPTLFSMPELMQGRGLHPPVPAASVPSVPGVPQGVPPGVPGGPAPDDNLIVNVEFAPQDFPQGGDLLNQYPLQPDLHPPGAVHTARTQGLVKSQHDILHQFLTDAHQF